MPPSDGALRRQLVVGRHRPLEEDREHAVESFGGQSDHALECRDGWKSWTEHDLLLLLLAKSEKRHRGDANRLVCCESFEGWATREGRAVDRYSKCSHSCSTTERC